MKSLLNIKSYNYNNKIFPQNLEIFLKKSWNLAQNLRDMKSCTGFFWATFWICSFYLMSKPSIKTELCNAQSLYWPRWTIVCFSWHCFADPRKAWLSSRGYQFGSIGLELIPPIARHLFATIVQFRSIVATFGCYNSNQYCCTGWFLQPYTFLNSPPSLYSP